MIDGVVAATNVGQVGLAHSLIRKMQDAGKETPAKEEIRVRKALEEERKKVQPIYNLKGKVVEYYENGRHLDVNA